MKLHIERHQLHIVFTFSEKLFGMHGNFVIPTGHIRTFSSTLPKATWKELRLPGTFLPGVIKAGSYLTSEGWDFWHVRARHPKMVVLELAQEKYRRIILSLPEEGSIPVELTRIRNI